MTKLLLAVLVALCSAGIALADAPGPGQPERRPEQRVEFPQLQGWSSLHISMSRTACFGACPIYDVDISGDGTVHFNGIRFTAVIGERTAKIPRQRVEALFDKFRRAQFFWLNDSYASAATDLPSCVLTLSFDGAQKRVRDYGGEMVGMPAVVRDLQHAVDEAAQTDRWVHAKNNR
jgi:hypothetical protein